MAFSDSGKHVKVPPMLFDLGVATASEVHVIIMSAAEGVSEGGP